MKTNYSRKRAFATAVWCTIVAVATSCSDTTPKRKGFITNHRASMSFTEGKWHISSFQVNGDPQTQLFERYRFTFTADNRIKIYTRDTLLTGEWWVTGQTADTLKGDSGLTFNMLLSHTIPLKYMNRKWEILERSPKLLRLLSTENGDSEYMVFEK